MDLVNRYVNIKMLSHIKKFNTTQDLIDLINIVVGIKLGQASSSSASSAGASVEQVTQGMNNVTM